MTTYLTAIRFGNPASRLNILELTFRPGIEGWGADTAPVVAVGGLGTDEMRVKCRRLPYPADLYARPTGAHIDFRTLTAEAFPA